MKVERDFIFDPSLVLYLPLYKLDGASFMSKDAYGHLCTVTSGPLWTAQGLVFDGSADKLQATFTGCSGTQNAGAKTISFWVYTPNTTGLGNLVCCSDNHGSNWEIYRATDDPALSYYATGETATVSYDFVTSVFTFITLIIDGSKDEILWFVNADYISTSSSANFGSDNGGNVLNIGVDNAGAPTYANGTFGALWIYNRRQTPQEILHNYLATKWRYQ